MEISFGLIVSLQICHSALQTQMSLLRETWLTFEKLRPASTATEIVIIKIRENIIRVHSVTEPPACVTRAHVALETVAFELSQDSWLNLCLSCLHWAREHNELNIYSAPAMLIESGHTSSRTLLSFQLMPGVPLGRGDGWMTLGWSKIAHWLRIWTWLSRPD